MNCIQEIMVSRKVTYICTIDNYHQDPDTIDYATSENPAEHKSHNLIELDNGQYALYPNNRMRIFDNSLTPVNPKMPDFKVSTQYYSVENGFDRLGMGREDEYFWKTAKEREESNDFTQFRGLNKWPTTQILIETSELYVQKCGVQLV